MGKIFKKLAAVLTAGLLLTSGLNASPVLTVNAAAGDTPDAEKSIKDNGDGTYTLSLDIVGESEIDTENTKANIVVILDRSGSMRYYVESDTGRYGSSNDDPPSQDNVYGNNRVTLYDANGNEVTNETTQGPVYTRSGYWPNYNYTLYTGKRYANELRMAVAKEAVNDLVDAMQEYNASVPNTVQMALVSFADRAGTNVEMTGTLANISNAINATGQSAINPSGGTNWEEALQTARTIAGNADDDPTYVIFVTDGNPTRYGTGQGTGQETTTNINTSYNAARDDARAIVNDGFTLYDLGVFGSVDRMESLTEYANGATSADKGTATYYSVADKAELQEAFAEIIDQISENIGITAVDIVDGTTSTVTTSSGVAHLLEVVPNSFKYYRSGGTYGTSTEWTSADDPAPPAASFNSTTGQVEWDLSSIGVLENDVKYTVTFDVYPSQETYDLIAQLKNGDIEYSKVDPEIQKYITEDTYSLRTNTTASYSWTDTREEEPEKHTENYKNPSPVATSADTLPIKKDWEGADPDVDSVEITVLMDGDEEFHKATLSKDNNWETSSFISVGLIKDGQVLPGAEGHDFSFAELDGSQYHWEIDAPTVRPMLINGGGEDHTPTMLIKVDDKHPAPTGAQTYTIDGSTYYVDNAAAGLTATNHRRSNLNLKKIVTGEDAPKDATFPFTLTVKNSKAPATEPADDPDHNSDYWVWFSIYDTDAGATVTDATITGATGPNADGYYYAPSGTPITVAMKANWNLRFTNVPSGTTYTFAEGTLADGFAFNKAELTAGEDSTFSGNQTTTGTIENTKTSYQVEYTNDYQLTNLEITKVWDDNDDQDGKRLTADQLKAKLTLSPAVEGKEATVVDNGDGTYTITYTGLPRFNNGQEVEYTVAESAIDGYTTTGSPAEDHGTITNKHVPEVVDIPVEKVWEDANDQDGIRPDSVEVQLKADGEEVGEPVELNEDNEWAYTWESLPKYADGEEIEYTVEEVETGVITGTDGPGTYAYEVTGDVEEGFTVTNTHTPEVVDIPVEKVWEDADDQDGIRPDSVEVQLLADEEEVGEPVELNEDNEWAYTWVNLPTFADGEEIEYTVEEVTTTVITGTDGPGTYAYAVTGSVTAGFTVTNTHTPETTTIDGEKTWDDEKYFDDEGAAIGEYERPNITVTLTGSDGKTYSVELDGTVDETVPTTAGGYESGEWAYTFVNLPKYEAGKVGVEIEYTLSESDEDGFIETVDGYDVTNTPEETKVVEGTSLTIKKVDALTEGELAGAVFTLTDSEGKTETFTTGADGTVTIEFDGYTTDEDVDVAKKSTYTLKETTAPNGYVADTTTYTITVEEEFVSVTLNSENVWEWLYNLIAGVPDATNFDSETSTLTVDNPPVETKLHVVKIWDDNNDQDGVRPDSVTVNLLAGEETIDSQELNEDNDWEYTWEELPAYADGAKISYTVTEDSISDIGYVTTVEDVTEEGSAVEDGYEWEVTNKYTPEETQVSAKKVWNDSDNQDGIRPQSVQVQLKADGTAVGDPVTLNATNEWKKDWEKLPKYADGVAIAYTVEEITTDVITGTDGPGTYAYAVTQAEDGSFTFTVTNTHTPEETEASAEKVWSDGDNQDGIRPQSVEVQLKADGTAVGDPVTLNAANEWKTAWTELPKFDDGKEIEYTVDEVKTTVITGTDGPGTYAYAVTQAEDGSFTFTVTNTHTPEVVEASVKKVWVDGDNVDGIRPATLSVTLSDGTTVTLSKDNGWSATVEDLPKYADGVEIVYTWTEDEVPEGYELTGNSTEGTLTTLTNTHETGSTEIDVLKVWSDADDQDGVRPTSIKVRLYATYTIPAEEVTETADDSAETEPGRGVPEVTDEGSEGNQEVVADAAADDSETEGEAPEMTESEETEEVEVAPAAEGTDTEEADVAEADAAAEEELSEEPEPTREAPRAAETVTEVAGEVTLDGSEENPWTYAWTDLPEYKEGYEGAKITYTVKEIDANDNDVEDGGNLDSNYKASYAVEEKLVTITNTHEPAKTEVSAEKVWDDADDQDGKRPGSVQVQLLADGTPSGSPVTLDDSNEWKTTWTELPMFKDHGTPIVYTVEEIETAIITGTDGPGTYAYDVINNGDGTFTVVNTHTPEETEISAEKVWDDEDDQDGKRPGSVQVQLLADVEACGDPVTLDDSNEWKTTWEELPKYAEGEEIVYTVDEVKTDVITGEDGPGTYAYEVKDNEDGTFTVTNTHTPEETEATVKKIWDDNEDKNKARPASLSVTLSEGTTVTLTEENSWTVTVMGLPKYENGVEIEYTWSEDEVPEGYTLTDISVDGTITSITNTFVDITVEKVDDDKKALKGAQLQVVDQDGTVVDSWTTDGTAHLIKGLEFGQTYTLKEVKAPEGYEKAADITFTADQVTKLQMVDKKIIVPDTSDHNTTSGWMMMLLTSLLTAGMAFATRRKYGHSN